MRCRVNKIKGQGLATKQDDHPSVLVSIKELLEAGAHFGHQRHRWNPKMKKYIFEERNGLHIIDLAKTLQLLRKGVEVVREVVSRHQSILFVGTKKQAKAVVREIAEECDEFYICERWLGGALTNLPTIRKSIKKLERIEKRITAADEGLTKKEMVLLTKLQIKLERNLSGVRGMRKPPGLLIIVDPSREHLAVAEANKLGIPILALVDTNCDPEPIDYVIPCNDDALKSIKLCLQTLSRAILDQKQALNMHRQKEAVVANASEQEEGLIDETEIGTVQTQEEEKV